MQILDPILRTKLRPPFIRQGLVSRPQLQAQIQQGLSMPLTLITAAAGFGKTTLVAACIASCGLPVAWLSVDKNDNQLSRFLRYLVASLQEADPAVGKEAAQLLAAAPDAAAEAILTSLINQLDSTGDEMVLVLDDYQLITNLAVHDSVAFLLDHRPANLHLVIDTRSDPPLPLSRLRARGQIVELRTDDLRFSVNEAIQFLNLTMGLNLDERAVSILEERTEGWIAGLQMASLAIQGRLSISGPQNLDHFIQEFAGTNRFVMDFMIEEVLAREPEAVQTFLLQTSILHRLSGPLCDAVTGSNDGQSMLEQLERRNLFLVSLDDDRRWYRYHHLFADLLQARLNQLGKEYIAQLYCRAAEWCDQERHVTEAVSYAFAAQNDELEAHLVEKYWQSMANNGEIETVYAWLSALPANRIKSSPSLGTAYCMVLWLMGQVGAIEAPLNDAERALAQQDETKQAEVPDGSVELRVIMTAMRSFVARFHEQHEAAITLAQRALDLIPDNLEAYHYDELRSLAFLALGSAYDGVGNLNRAVSSYAEMIRGCRLTKNTTGVAGITFRMVGALRLLGRLREADTACREGLKYLEIQGMGSLPAAGILHVAMAEVLVEQNDLEAVEAQLAQGSALGKWSGRLDASINAVYVQTRLSMARQDPAGALSAIEEIKLGLVQSASALYQAELLAYKTRLLIQQGAISEASQCIEEANRLIGCEQGQTRSILNLAACRVFAAMHPSSEAILHLSQEIDQAEACGQIGMALELRLLRSLAHIRQGQTASAEADLERALALANTEGYVRIFLDEGQPMQRLITHWLSHAGVGPLRDFAKYLLAQFDADIETNPLGQKRPFSAGENLEGEVRRTKTKLVEPLSPRELEVLTLMATGYTNEAIARQLIVTRGTIKAHAASIYRKLDVANRTEAVARARRLGLLP